MSSSQEDEKHEAILNQPEDGNEEEATSRNTRKAQLTNDLRHLRQRIGDSENAKSSAEKLLPLLRTIKALENLESESRSNFDARRLEFEAEVSDLEDKLGFSVESESLREDLDRSVEDSVLRLYNAKKELAGRLRAVLSLRRRIDEVPTQAELIQYERRFSELNDHIQEKHQQTRKYYDTYNALLEIKEWMLKETSLLNSISAQFQDALTSAEGRMKLINSMEGIVKSSQQKLQKVTVGLHEEQKVCDALKKKYAMAMAEQRRCYSLSKFSREQ